MKILAVSFLLFVTYSPSCFAQQMADPFNTDNNSFVAFTRDSGWYTPATCFFVRSLRAHYLVTTLHSLTRSTDSSSVFIPRYNNTKDTLLVKSALDGMMGKILLREPSTQKIKFAYYNISDAADSTVDVAVMKIDNLPPFMLPYMFHINDIDTSLEAKMGTKAYAVGFPRYKGDTVTGKYIPYLDTLRFVITGPQKYYEPYIFNFSDSDFDGRGMSGSPVCSIENGRKRLIGVLRGKSTAVYAAYIKRIIDKLETVL